MANYIAGVQGIQIPDFAGTIAAGQQAYQQKQDGDQQNALRAFLAQNGSALMEGDKNALAGLAAISPEAAFAIRDKMTAEEVARAGMTQDAARTAIAGRQADAGIASDNAKLEMLKKKFDMEMSADQRAEAAARVQEALAPAATIDNAADWDAYWKAHPSPSTDKMVGDFEHKAQHMAQGMTVLEALNASKPPAPTDVAPGHTLVGPDNKPVFTAPTADEPYTLSTNQTRYGPNNEVLAEGPAAAPVPLSPAGKLNQDAKNGFVDPGAGKQYNTRGETLLRKEFNQLQPVKDFQQQSAAMGRIDTSGSTPTAAGDMALIFAYMKLLDPGSTVRESEYATAAQAGSIPDRIVALYNKANAGETLNQDMRDDFLDRAQKLYENAHAQFAHISAQYRRIARAQHLRPNRAVPNYDVQASEDAAPPPPDPLGAPPPPGGHQPPPEFIQQLQGAPAGTKVQGPDGTVYQWDGQSLAPVE